jgi:hypothetical protein
VRLTPATLTLRDALAKVLAECSHPRDGDRQFGENRDWWERLADDALSDRQPLAVAVDRVRREAFESGSSPAIAVLLTELEESLPGQYQDGLARAVVLLSNEMAQHYGSVFEAGLRVGREQALKTAQQQAAADGG